MTSSIVSGSSLLRQFRFLPSSSLARRSIVAIGSGRGIASTSASASTSSDHVHAHHISAENAVVPPPSVVHLPLTEWPFPVASTASIPSPADPQTVEPPATTSPAYVTLPAHVFASPSRPDILHRCVVTHLSNLRQGTARTKNRAETKGSNRKIMRQKGTGKARVGDIRSPIRRGGGRAFPKRERDWTLGLNRKVWELGVRTALSERWRRGEVRYMHAAFRLLSRCRLTDAFPLCRSSPLFPHRQSWQRSLREHSANPCASRHFPFGNLHTRHSSSCRI